jgi:hypothetical protein
MEAEIHALKQTIEARLRKCAGQLESVIAGLEAFSFTLRSLDDLFRTPDIDPPSEWHTAYSDRPATKYAGAYVADDPPSVEHVGIIVSLPGKVAGGDRISRIHEAIRNYCDAHLVTLERRSRRNNSLTRPAQ